MKLFKQFFYRFNDLTTRGERHSRSHLYLKIIRTIKSKIKKNNINKIDVRMFVRVNV